LRSSPARIAAEPWVRASAFWAALDSARGLVRVGSRAAEVDSTALEGNSDFVGGGRLSPGAGVCAGLDVGCADPSATTFCVGAGKAKDESISPCLPRMTSPPAEAGKSLGAVPSTGVGNSNVPIEAICELATELGSLAIMTAVQ